MYNPTYVQSDFAFNPASDGTEWYNAKPNLALKLDIEQACDEVCTRYEGQQVETKDCKGIIEEVIVSLKDSNGKWIEFDSVPRTHGNPIYACIYHRIYKRLIDQASKKDLKPMSTRKRERNQRDTTEIIKRAEEVEDEVKALGRKNKEARPTPNKKSQNIADVTLKNQPQPKPEIDSSHATPFVQMEDMSDFVDFFSVDAPFWKKVIAVKRDIKTLRKHLKKKEQLLNQILIGITDRFQVSAEASEEN